MENPDIAAAEVKLSFYELEKSAHAAKDQLRRFLKGLSKVQMIAEIKRLQLSDLCLNIFCEAQILDAQDCEICMAVQEIRKEMEALEARQASYSPTLYYYSKNELRTSYLYQDFD